MKRTANALALSLLALALLAGCKPDAEPVKTEAAVAPVEPATPAAEAAPTALAGVSSTVLQRLDLADIHLPEGNKPLDCRSLRFRKVDVVPGGVIGIHSHENRPAILGVIQGAANLHAHKHDVLKISTGEGYKEYMNFHYAENASKTEPLTMITFDLLDDESPCKGVTYPQHTPLYDAADKAKDPFVVQAPKEAEGESSTPFFAHPVADITFGADGAPLAGRALRMRSVTLDPGVAIPQQTFENRPSYLMVLDGSINVKIAAKNDDGQTLTKREPADLVNQKEVEIKNASASAPAHYLVMELWDPKDVDVR